MERELAHRCQISVQPRDRGTLITIAGCIDGTASFQALAEKAVPPIVIDLGGVDFIDSTGVRDWIQFLSSLKRPVTLRRCSEPMVFQFNMVRGTLQDATVESFLAPYECEGCGRLEAVELHARRDIPDGARSRPPRFPCSTCNGHLAFAEHPQRYLVFLQP